MAPTSNTDGPLVQLRAVVRDRLPQSLLRLAREHGHEDVELAEQGAAAADRRAMFLVRDLRMAAVPRRGEMVVVYPAVRPSRVQSVAWQFDPGPGEPVAVVEISEVDEDEVDLEEMLDAGWRPQI